MTKPLQEIRDELASNILQEKIAMEPGEDMFTAMFKKGFDSALTELSKRAGDGFDEQAAQAGYNIFSAGDFNIVLAGAWEQGARWQHEQLMPRVAGLKASFDEISRQHTNLEKEVARLREALERIAKIRTLPLTDSNDTDEELAAQYSSVIDALVHISREALSGREEGGG